MKCPKCNNELQIKLSSNIMAKGCRVLTAMTTIVTAQCEKCNEIMQIPLSSKAVFSVKKKE